MNNIDLLKQALASAASVIITMLGFWLGYLKDIPTRAEVCQQTETLVEKAIDENPYLKDRSLIIHRLDTMTGTVKDLDHSVRELNSRLDRLPNQRASGSPSTTPDKAS